MTTLSLFARLLECLHEKVHSEEFLEEFRIQGHFVRKRCLSMYHMVMFLLFHSKATIDSKLDLCTDLFPQLNIPKVSKQAISKARYGISHLLFKELFQLSVDYYYKNIGTRKRWKSRYHLFAIDGSDLEAPSSESAFRIFGKNTDKKNPDYSWSMALASTLYDILEDIVVDASLQAQFAGEREAAVRHLARLKDLKIDKNAIVIFDRGYYSADLFLECVNTGCKCLMRLKSSYKICNTNQDDAFHMITVPGKKKIKCRVLRVTLTTGENEYLITNVFDKDISCDDFRDLYFERWKIEEKYLEIKEFWKIEEFTGTGVLAVCQDFFITMLHVNMAGILRAEADRIIEETTDSKNVYKYRARRSYAMRKVQLQFIRWLMDPPSEAALQKVAVDLAQKKSQVRPGRTRDRSNQRDRAKKHYNNRKTFF